MRQWRAHAPSGGARARELRAQATVYTNGPIATIRRKFCHLCTLFTFGPRDATLISVHKSSVRLNLLETQRFVYTVRVSPASAPSRARILDGALMPYLYCVRPYERAPGFANVPFRLWMSRCNFDALARAGDQELYFSNSKWQPDARRRSPGKKGRQHGRT